MFLSHRASQSLRTAASRAIAGLPPAARGSSAARRMFGDSDAAIVVVPIATCLRKLRRFIVGTRLTYLGAKVTHGGRERLTQDTLVGEHNVRRDGRPAAQIGRGRKHDPLSWRGVDADG